MVWRRVEVEVEVTFTAPSISILKAAASLESDEDGLHSIERQSVLRDYRCRNGASNNYLVAIRQRAE